MNFVNEIKDYKKICWKALRHEFDSRTTAFRWQEFCSMRDAIICALTKRILENDALEENEKKRTIEAWKPVIEFVVFNVYYAYNEEST